MAVRRAQRCPGVELHQAFRRADRGRRAMDDVRRGQRDRLRAYDRMVAASSDSCNSPPMTPLPASDDPAGSGPGRPDGRPAPLIWLLLSDKLGDNAQVRTIADALPWPSVEKRLLVQPQFA